MGVFETLENALNGSVEFIREHFGNHLIAILILFIGLFIGRFFERLIHKSLSEIELNKIIRKIIITESDFENLIAKSVSYLIYLVSVILFLVKIGVVKTLFWIIVVIAALLAISSLLFGVRDMIPNLWAGFFIGRGKRHKTGDRISIGDVEGTIKKFSITDVVVETYDGNLMHFANSKIGKEFKIKKLKKS
ncbi:mechanosensitive ion channel [Candidatus Woesearchaeota archaeon]|nr:mechanosensitive ion channel [Candidatus Woesearchaeota archaeon]